MVRSTSSALAVPIGTPRHWHSQTRVPPVVREHCQWRPVNHSNLANIFAGAGLTNRTRE